LSNFFVISALENPNAEFGFNQNFVNLYLDAEKGEGAEKAKHYGVRAYPTLVFVSPDGKVVKFVEGYHKPDELIRLGKIALNK
jgi:thioredoxin 1